MTTSPPPPADVSVIILTYNEEANIAQALRSAAGWARQIFVVDSFSTDRTVEIARSFPCEVVQHPFENYSKQRNFALSHLPIGTEWIFFLDADEWLPETLKEEIRETIRRAPRENGYFLKWRLIWMGRWIRRGYYPTWILRLARRGKVRCEDRPVNEHLVVEGPTGYLKNDFIHEDRKGITSWIAKHNAYAAREAEELLRRRTADFTEIPARFGGTQAERKRWIRKRIWERLPPLVRPFLYFGYRYFLRGGFLDGKAAFVYHFLHALWFPLLIDVKYLELRARAEAPPRSPDRP
ncbi:MAG TPA: glycosyltransferase family 2 protein [Planctomycetota bacterium]|nr:glycosyltransferase family 2 protein [Planctomycetota bacterium]